MEEYSKIFIRYVVVISLGVTVLGGLFSFFFCTINSSLSYCDTPTFEIVLGAVIGVATTALFFWLIEKRQADLEESQNIGFMNIVYPMYVGALHIGWWLSLMYYSEKPKEEWDKVLKTCNRFDIPVIDNGFNNKNEFEFFLNYGCWPKNLMELESTLISESYPYSEFFIYNIESLKNIQLKIRNELEKNRSIVMKEFRIKYGIPVGDMVYVGWFLNKFVAKTLSFEAVINEGMIDKFLNALQGFHADPKIVKFCKKTFDLWMTNKITSDKSDAFIDLVYDYIAFAGSALKVYNDLLKFLSSKISVFDEDFVRKSSDLHKQFPDMSYFDIHTVEKVEGESENANELSNLNLYKESIVWSDKALEIDPKNVNALYEKGVSLSWLKQHNDAIVWYDKVLEIDPKDVETLLAKGDALAWLEKYHEAIVWYDKALEIDPKHVETLCQKGNWTLQELKQYHDAIVLFDKVLEIDPKNVRALRGKGDALSRLKQYHDAIVWYDKVLEIDPKNVRALSAKGIPLMHIGKKDEAMSYCDKALEIDPKSTYASYRKARILSLAHNSKESIKYLKNVIEFEPLYKKEVKTESDFDNIREMKSFKKLF